MTPQLTWEIVQFSECMLALWNSLSQNAEIINRFNSLPSVLWLCWLGGSKGIQPVKTGTVICLEWVADLHMAQLTPLSLTVSCFSNMQIGFTFLVPAHLGSPEKRASKRVCVCVFNWLILADKRLEVRFLCGNQVREVENEGQNWNQK